MVVQVVLWDAEVWLWAVLVLVWGLSVACCVWKGSGKMCGKQGGLLQEVM